MSFDLKYWEGKKEKKVEEFNKLKEKTLQRFLDIANEFSQSQFKLTADYNDISKIIKDASPDQPVGEEPAVPDTETKPEEPTTPEKTA